MLKRHWLPRKTALVALALALSCFAFPTMPVQANFLKQLYNLHKCLTFFGVFCDMSETVEGTGPPAQPIPVTCSPPLLNGLPQFLSWPKGSAKYRFQSTCTSPAVPNAFMTARWEGSWTPAETKTDRPNASETLEVTGWEPFLPNRTPGGKIFMFFTARCTRDPWLQSGGCTPYGVYAPDDFREAVPDIDKQSFPRTGDVISPADKKRLYAEYRRANPLPGERLGIRQRIPSQIVQAPTPADTGVVQKPRSNPNIFSRGTEAMDVPQAEAGVPDQSADTTASLESVPDTSPTPPITVTLDQALHFQSAKGDDVLVAAGVYEIEPVLDLQLSLSKEGQQAILLPAEQDQHAEPLTHPVAILVQEEQTERRHLILLMPYGQRFDVVGSSSGIQSRGPGMVALKRPSVQAKEAMTAPTPNTPAPLTPQCRPNPNPFGPRWIPVPCTMPTPPPPYFDGSNLLHACVNNITGAFRLVQPSGGCTAENDEVKVKWQLVP
ncbi:MAG: hypothetical protein P0111_10415 [Nitrospira sp.]|nr:hypothetical protein [Nitrospira sp.]